MTTRLYQSRFFTPPQPEVVTEDKWHHDHSQPVRSQAANKAAKYLVAALAGCVLTPIAYPGTGDAVASTVSTSIRHDKAVIYDELAYAPYVAPGATETYAATNTNVRFRKTIIYDDVIYAPHVDQAEDVTLDKWVGQVNQPTLRQRITEGHLTFVGDSSDRFDWRQPLSVPARAKPRPAGTFTFVADAIERYSWQQPFSQPVRAKPRLEGDYTTSPTQPQANDGIGWHRPLAEPTRRVAARQKQELIFAGKPDDPAYWFQPLSEPTRVKVRQNEGSFVYPYQTVVTGTAGDGAYLPGTVTTSVQYDRTIIYDELAYAPHTPAAADEIADASSNTTVRFRKTIIYDDVAYSPYVEVAETVTSDKWFAPFSQPRFVKRVTGEEGSFFFGGDSTDRYAWHRPLSEPTRRKPFREGQVIYSPTLVEDAAIQAKWFQPFGTPRAAKRAPEFPAFAYSPYFVPPESGVGVEFNWWPNLSERLRQRRPVAQQQAVIQGPPQPITVTLEYAWHAPLSLPTRRKPSLAETDAQVFVYAPAAAEDVTLDKWFVEFGKPVRVKRLTGEEGSIFFVGDSADRYAWRQPLSEPVRRKASARTGTFALAPFPQVSGPDRWMRPLDLPVRRKVSAALQSEPVMPNFVPAPSYGWYVELDEPTRRVVFRTLYRPHFEVELEFTPSSVTCSHTEISFSTATITVSFGTADVTELASSADTTIAVSESDTEVDWSTATTDITECEN
jgi:hypothetical protein